MKKVLWLVLFGPVLISGCSLFGYGFSPPPWIQGTWIWGSESSKWEFTDNSVVRTSSGEPYEFKGGAWSDEESQIYLDGKQVPCYTLTSKHLTILIPSGTEYYESYEFTPYTDADDPPPVPYDRILVRHSQSSSRIYTRLK